MDWAGEVKEVERLEREESAARHTARATASRPPPSTPKPAAKAPAKKATAMTQPKPTGKPAPNTAHPAPPKPVGGVSYAAAAKAAPPSPAEWTTVTKRRQGFRPQQGAQRTTPPRPVEGLNLDQRKFVFVREGTNRKDYHTADIMSATARALFQEGVPTHIRIFQLCKNEKGTIAGLSTPFAPVEQLLLYRDTILRAA